MDSRLSRLRENQHILGSKLLMLQETGRRKEEEVEKIKELIAECRENLNKLHCEADDRARNRRPCEPSRPDTNQSRERSRSRQNDPCGARGTDSICAKIRQEMSLRTDETAKKSYEDPCAKYRQSGDKPKTPCDNPCARYSREKSPCVGKQDPCASLRAAALSKPMDPCVANQRNQDPCDSDATKLMSKVAVLANAQENARQCIDEMSEKMEKEMRMKITSQCGSSDRKMSRSEGENMQDRISCKVDLSKMKVNVKGAPEDLKKLDAVQLVSLLEKFQCQELVINTGCVPADVKEPPKEISVIYILHPGNIALIFGIVMVAFLINSNLCDPCRTCSKKLMLTMLYISSLAFHCGAVLWMNFIRGLTLRAGLSRDTFHSVDNLILPKYFSICVFLSALTLYSFLSVHCISPCTSWPLTVLIQVIIASSTFLLELITVCYVVPAVVKIRAATDDYSVEGDTSPPPSFTRNMEKLAKLNWTICLINMITVVFMGSNLYYVSTKILL